MFVREVTKDFTLRELAERYKISKSSWGEYRAGTKLIDLHLLQRVVRDLVRDERGRVVLTARADKLHQLARDAESSTPPGGPGPGPVAGPDQILGSPNSGLRESEEILRALREVVTHLRDTAPPPPSPAPAPEGEARFDRETTLSPDAEKGGAPERITTPKDVRAPAENAQERGEDETEADPLPSSKDPRSHSEPKDGAPPTAPATLTARVRHWRTPALWAALAALVAALVANHIHTSDDRPGTTSQADSPEQSQQTTTPTEPGPYPAHPMVPGDRAPAVPQESQSRSGMAGIVAATSSHLYRITPDANVEEYTGKTNAWKIIRKRTERIFTSPTTLYATDAKSGSIEEYDRSKQTWTVIGGPGSHFAATATHLYGVATDHRGTFEYSGTPGLWHKMRGATERIFTSPTTLYATDSSSGKLQQYNRSKNTWEPIGDPLSSFAATKNHLYSVSTDLSSIYQYSNPPGSWSLIDRP
ncbi:hypothetical protein ACIOGT_39105 [Streptomyces microflavus]|uniref:hypothetical protein n=2 Tax=Streptomyces microflavus TaxID=1919 RepID=UPI0037F88652